MQNRKAHFEYFINEKFESGIQLTGTEVKSIRANQCSISEAYVLIDKNEAFICNMNISKIKNAFANQNHEPLRKRKLLLHKKEIIKIKTNIKLKGSTVIALRIYSNHKGLIKVEIALAKGKKLYDKRQDIKAKDIARAERLSWSSKE